MAEETQRTTARTMLHRPSSASGRHPRSEHEERQAVARLAFALGHVLRLYRVAAVACGQPVGAITKLEDDLGRARLPDEYIDLARAVTALESPPLGVASGLSAPVYGRFALLLRDMARALAMERIESEIVAVTRVAIGESIDPEPLLAVARRLVQSLLVQQSTTEMLEDCLQNVDGGIQRMALDEAGLGTRLSTMRERLLARPPDQEIETMRRMLVDETRALEDLVADRRRALEDLQRQSRMAQRRAERLLAALADATSAACTDPLTSLGNRRGLSETVARLASSATQTGVLALDVDHFKVVNDTYGHGGGDRVLIQLAEMLRAELRGDDYAFRVGGEEIVVLLARCDATGALATAERIRERVAMTPTQVGNRRVAITVSIGGALWKAGTSFEATHDAADEALYQAKRAGRNCCLLAS